ncbi:hypothetical protein EAG_04319 [Camponotus floridanus]|uniref:Uncharacterized protein n=1 Tax=Camponotus floridanus TaxID=104421 RepID=E2AHP6_CAMFO|nr:hypothetical protein EAG_04319 [Camponotus floridanus]
MNLITLYSVASLSIDNAKAEAMFLFVLLSSFLVLSHICIVDDALDWDFPARFSATIVNENIHGHVPYVEAKVYESFEPSLRRRLLEHPRWIKQAYRDNDYNVVRKRHQFQNKLDENRSYRSAVKDNENEDEEEEDEEEEEEEEDEGDEEDKNVDEETEEQDENEEEMVNEEPSEIYDYGRNFCRVFQVAAAVRSESKSRVVRSGYVPFGGKVGERERQEIVRIRSATEECEDESTESPQYYEYANHVTFPFQLPPVRARSGGRRVRRPDLDDAEITPNLTPNRNVLSPAGKKRRGFRCCIRSGGI